MSTNYPTSLDSYTTKNSGEAVLESHVNNLQDAVVALETKVGIDNSAVTTSLDYYIKNFFSSGRKLWIYANSAPTGWTYYSTASDCVIGCKGGSNAYNNSGGDGYMYGSWTSHGLTNSTETSNHTHTGPFHSHLGGVHYHSSPTHTHDIPIGVGGEWIVVSANAALGESGAGYAMVGIWGNQISFTKYKTDLNSASNTGYNSANSTALGGNGNTSTESATHGHNISSNGAYRPVAALGIIIQKS